MISFCKKIIVLSLVLLFLLVGTYLYNPVIFHEFKINVAKYTQMNISQNTGTHRSVLKIIEKLNNYLPYYSYVDFERQESDVGVDGYDYKTLYENALITRKIEVTNEKEIIDALNSSLPGTAILIAAGVYRFEGRLIKVSSVGTLFEPILLYAGELGDVVFEMSSSEGFLLNKPNWRIQNIIFKGIKDEHDRIDHALHIAGDADNIQILNNEFINFNAHIKSNGTLDSTGVRVYPDNVLIQHNNFYNEWKRNTLSPASPIDVVGGNNWIIKDNFIADFGKWGRKGFGTTYGVFLKGGGENGTIENNVVNCEWKVPHTSPMDIRIGISLGNGGTENRFCPNNLCEFEHKNGIVRNNTILNCKNDVGIYLNKAAESVIESNVIKNSIGIDLRFNESSAIIRNNYLNGRIKARDGASLAEYDNVIL